MTRDLQKKTKELVLAPPLGTQTIGAGVDFNPAGLAEAFRATASTSSTVDSVSVYVDSSSQATSLVAGIYADNGSNDPGQLLAKGLLTSVVSGTWNRVSLPTVSLGAGTRYWIALLGPLGRGTVRFRDLLRSRWRLAEEGHTIQKRRSAVGLGRIAANRPQRRPAVRRRRRLTCAEVLDQI